MTLENNGKGPLAGLKIIEFEGIGPAPLAGQLLSHLGAHVVKIEREPVKKKPVAILDRNKTIINLNLKKKENVEAILKLLEKADVLIEGFRPGVMERLGLGPKECHKKKIRA